MATRRWRRPASVPPAWTCRPSPSTPSRAGNTGRHLLLALEQRIVLADAYPGMLADDLSDYLFARSTGHIGSLMTLINRGCQRAVRTGAERLSQQLLDRVRNDAGAEQARAELAYALTAGKATSRPRRKQPTP